MRLVEEVGEPPARAAAEAPPASEGATEASSLASPAGTPVRRWSYMDLNGTLFEIFELIPSFRYYSQSQASFYGPVFRFGAPEFRTSDFRLSPYGAFSYGLRGNVNLSGWPDNEMSWIFSLFYQRYLSSGDFALVTVRNANPGLVDYHLFSVNLGARF